MTKYTMCDTIDTNNTKRRRKVQNDTSVTIQSGELRTTLSGAWRQAQESGGPLVVTVNGVPDFIIFPLAVAIPLVHRGRVLEMSRRMYSPLLPDGIDDPPAGYDEKMPTVGPDMLRRSLGEQRRRMRSLMTPFLFTHYDQDVGVLFPVPFEGGQWFVDQMTRQWYPERFDKALMT